MKNKSIRFLSGQRIQLGDSKQSRVAVTRVGSFHDPRYGKFDITGEMLLAMVSNFEKGTYGQEIFYDVAHEPDEGTAGTIKSLLVENDVLIALVEWTDYGIEAIENRKMVYSSAEYSENFRDNETGIGHGPTLLGAALTNRPVIKRLDPIRLSEPNGEGSPIIIDQSLIETLTRQAIMKLSEAKAGLVKKLAELKLSETVAAQLTDAFETAAKMLGDDEKAIDDLSAKIFETGKKLAEATPGETIKLDLTMPGQSVGLTAEDVAKLLAEHDSKKLSESKKLADNLAANQKIFDDALDAAEGIKALSESTRKVICSARDMITAEMNDSQVKALAENQIRLGNELSVNAQLAARGFGNGDPSGSVRITLDETNNIKALQETIDKRLKIEGLSESRRFSATGGKLQSENKKLADEFIAMFDADPKNAPRLHAEHKMLAAGSGVVADTDIPAIFERTVIREAIYQLIGLQFVDSATAPFANSAQIPYSFRDTTAAGIYNTRVYQGGSIPRAGVKQVMDIAYPIPQKLAFEVSDEMRYLTASGILNWDAVSENQRNASRIIAEDLERLIFDEQIRASDEYGAVSVSAEDLGADADGTNNVFALANFPVVQPRASYDLAGNLIGSISHPIVITLNAVVIQPYDFTGNQSAGTYYVMLYNTGEFYFVDESGAMVTPGAVTLTIDYYYSTNAYKFDTDHSTADDVFWDSFLYRYGLRKSLLEDTRSRRAEFGLMSGTAMTQIEQAKQFAANSRRAGTDLQADGNLGRIKDVPNYKSYAPGLVMGDTRVLIGERNQTRLRMMKPWTMGVLQDQKDSNGRFTGQKEAYGDQFLVLHTPIPLRDAFTSIVLYDSTARVARVGL